MLIESDNNNFVRHFHARKLHVRPLLSRNFSQNTSFSTDFAYDCRNVLKHVGINKEVMIYTGESDLMKRSLSTIPYFLLWPKPQCVYFHVHMQTSCLGANHLTVVGREQLRIGSETVQLKIAARDCIVRTLYLLSCVSFIHTERGKHPKQFIFQALRFPEDSLIIAMRNSMWTIGCCVFFTLSWS